MRKILLTFCLLFASLHAFALDLTVTWDVPLTRENNQPITVAELGGYEIHFQKATDPDTAYTTIIVNNGAITTYKALGLDPKDYIVYVAAFDKQFLYSNFVKVSAPLQSKPSAVRNVKVSQGTAGTDPTIACKTNTAGCKVIQ